MSIQAELRCRAGGAPALCLASLEALMALATDEELTERQREPAFWKELAARWHHVASDLRSQDRAREHYDRVAEALGFGAVKRRSR